MIDVCDEVHGMRNVRKMASAEGGAVQYVTVAADGLWIRLNKSEGTAFPAGLTPAEARYLASKLYRCARLVEQRRAQHSGPANP